MWGSNRGTDMENRLVDMGRGEERARCMDRVIQKLTLPYARQIASENLLYDSGNSNQACDSLDRWEGSSEGRGYMYTYD